MSVVVPVYGVEAYLPRCVDSLLQQTYPNIEIILVDDGSPDRCGAICDSYALKDPRVRVIHQDNAGPSAARNRGIGEADGEYLTFVDPDDWVHDDLIHHLTTIATQTGADVSVCQFVRTTDENMAVPGGRGDMRILGTNEALALYGSGQASLMTSPCAKLFRASLFDEVRFPEGRLYEDEFTTWRLMARARGVALSGEVRYYYFLRPESATQRTQAVRQLLDRVDALNEQAAHLRSVGLSAASGSVLKKSFLVQRQVRRRVIAEAPESSSQLRHDLRETAALIRESSQPRALKTFASAYAVAPQPFDLAIAALQKAKRVAKPTSKHARSAAARGNGNRELEIVVVAYGFPAMLRSALEPVLSYPITVVDNSSLPAIRDLCAELGCRYIDPDINGGFAAGVNVGLANRASTESDVLLLNPDAVISAEDVSRLHAALLTDAALASVGPQQMDDSGEPIRVAWPCPSPLGVWLDAVGLSRLRPRAEYVSGAILLLRAEAIADVGPFDDRFFLYVEEADWQYRAQRRNWRHQVVDSVTAMHAGGATSTDEQRRQTYFHASHERFLRKHYGALGWQAARLGQLAGDLIRAGLRSGAARERLIARISLYLRGPMRAERLLRSRADAGPTHPQREVA